MQVFQQITLNKAGISNMLKQIF